MALSDAVRTAAEDPLAERAHHFLEELADRLALGIASVTAVVDPGVVVLGGPNTEAGGRYLSRLVAARLSRHAFVRAPVRLAELGEDAILAGAVEIGLRTLRQELFAN